MRRSAAKTRLALVEGQLGDKSNPGERGRLAHAASRPWGLSASQPVRDDLKRDGLRLPHGLSACAAVRQRPDGFDGSDPATIDFSLSLYLELHLTKATTSVGSRLLGAS